MLLLLLLIMVITTIIVTKIYWEDKSDVIDWVKLSLFLSTPLIILIIYNGSKYSNIISIDDKIKLYENQNQQIQSEISQIVENYKTYETEIFIREVSLITLIETYPELKSNELVTTQIDLYVENNSKIIELKEQKIDLKLTGWWLFFNIGVNYE